ncbi:(p)ppGpp synthetase [Pectobacterium brasiliense]|uniref:GTP pyrophosphokinase n=1 Tax=Pectobacterium brasiliense TaxID=180957 RepID=UPI000C1C718A|nr:(p)ppGpp synthetase [Pectobacterium brasiliense]ATV42584.1 (p)ppGpp synthetase [Pectobacterium brasiliense]
MNESEFLQRWNQEESMYRAWGDFVVSNICRELVDNKCRNLNSFLKQPATPRVKEKESLIDKAFHRLEKSYEDPYKEIEDKVGVRFVVLLTSDIDDVCDVIKRSDKWFYKTSRHYDEERLNTPLIFTYQSVHFIVTAKQSFDHNGVFIEEGIPCEIQVRTLLQHAYAELTHDAIYKAKTIVEPDIHRTVARSMALIETTDDFFCSVAKALNNLPDAYIGAQKTLDQLYMTLIKEKPNNQKSAILILDTFKKTIDADIISRLYKFIEDTPELESLIRDGKNKSSFYEQSITIFVYWLIKRRKSILQKEWPLEWKIIQKMAADIGVSLERQM